MCPFRYRRRWTKFSFGVDPEFMDHVMAIDDAAEREYEKKYPTCWRRFLHWLGLDALLESVSAQPIPCPYCSNPDRDFWAYDRNNSTRACKFDVPAHGGSDPPCICDHYGTLQGY